MLKKVILFEVDYFYEGLFGEYLSMLWFVNESFDLFTHQAAMDRNKIQFFSLFHELPILERSIAVRRACSFLE